MSLFEYAAYYNFFVDYFGNPLIGFAMFLFWLGFTVLGLLPLKQWRLCRGWILWPKLVTHISAAVLLYLVFGALIAPAYFGGEAEFLYDSNSVRENMLERGGLGVVLLWPLTYSLVVEAKATAKGAAHHYTEGDGYW